MSPADIRKTAYSPVIAFLSNENDSIWLIYPVSNILMAENLP